MKNPTTKRLFPLTFLALSGVLSVFLTACSAERSSRSLSAMQVRELELSEETKKVTNLLDTHASSQIFEYKMDGNMKEIHFFVEEFKDGKLTCLGQAGGPAAESGTFAVLFDPDEITLSWDGGKYSFLLDTSSSYTSTVTSRLTDLSSAVYNEKTAVTAAASTLSNSIRSCDVTDYQNLIGLTQEDYDRVLFVTAAFTDFTSNGELLSYHQRVRDQSSLSDETVKWLESYNQLTVMNQLAVSSIPVEFMDLTGNTATAADEAAQLSKPPFLEPPREEDVFQAPKDRLLIVDGKLYRGTSEIGPMGDAGSVDGTIRSVIDPDKTPPQEGQANFGQEGSPYTWDNGDGTIMVFEDGEYYIFKKETEEPPLTGTYCAFLKRLDARRITIDPVEWITTDDTQRIKELGLTESDMPDGYYIYNPSQSRTSLQLTENTIYRFIDWGRDFVQSDSTDEPTFETTDLQQFLKYLATYTNSEPGMPFFIDVRDGIVERIVEEPIA